MSSLKILNYTKNAKITLFQGTDYEETHENYNYSLEGGRYSLKGADGLKTGSSPTADYNYTLTVNRGNQRFVQSLWELGITMWKLQRACATSLEMP